MKILVKICKTAKLVANNTTRLIEGDIQREWKKSCNKLRNDTIDIWHSKMLCFWKNHKGVFNQLNLVSWIVLRVKSREMIMSKSDRENGSYQNDQGLKEVIKRKLS